MGEGRAPTQPALEKMQVQVGFLDPPVGWKGLGKLRQQGLGDGEKLGGLGVGMGVGKERRGCSLEIFSPPRNFIFIFKN